MNPSAQFPLATGRDWGELLGALQARPEGAFVAGLPERAAMGIAAAPLAIARWIALRAPTLAARASLRLLIIGAEKLDAVDRGRWYQLIPALLGRELRVEATLVGDRLEAEFRSPIQAHAPREPARQHRGSLASYLETPGSREHDLAFVFHPGFQKHQAWLRDGSLTRVVATMPLVAAAYESEESEVDRRVVECYGFTAPAAVLLNPFYVDLGEADSSIRWGHALWQFGSRAPHPDHAPDSARLLQLEQLARMVMHSIALRAVPLHPYGAKLEFRASDGARCTLVYVFDEFFMDPRDARLLSFRAGVLTEVGRVTMDEVAAYSAADHSDLDRAIWAADIKARALRHFCPPTLDDEAQQRLAQSMHERLEKKVDAIFSVG